MSQHPPGAMTACVALTAPLRQTDSPQPCGAPAVFTVTWRIGPCGNTPHRDPMCLAHAEARMHHPSLKVEVLDLSNIG